MTKSATSLSSRELLDGDVMTLTGHALLTKSSPKWIIFLMNLTSFRIPCFNHILISAATNHIGKTKLSKKSKLWMSPHVRAKIRTQDRLHRTIRQNRQEWIDACREPTKAINEAKTELERSHSRRNVECRWPKYMESHPRSEWFSWCQLSKQSNVPRQSNHHQRQI